MQNSAKQNSINSYINKLKNKINWYWRPIDGWLKSKDLLKNPTEQNFPIDFVVTWVDGGDLEWQREKEYYYTGGQLQKTDNCTARYRDWELLLYWFRAVEKYAPWVNKVYFVTNGQLPEWLNINNDKMRFITHKEFIPEKYLPTFCSDVIELNLWRIPGLSEHFVYFNDDVFLNNFVKPEDFFQHGLPNCFAVAKPICVDKIADFWQMRMLNDYAIINSSFDIRQSIEKFPEKFYSCILTKGEKRANNRLYMDNYISGMVYTHTVQNFLKSTFEEIWNRHEDSLDTACRTKFRTIDDLTIILAKLWQIFSGNFFPVKAKHFDTYIPLTNQELGHLVDALRSDQYKFLCINDCVEIEDESVILDIKKNLIKAFEEKFPMKSEFEL
ncbi:Stealth CR1 domain-containing protein [Lachnospiraceae bacterium C1.1]|nr:Stealth CR1 domain-containing protein [Lachnospiraceae bacterium C1.1]